MGDIRTGIIVIGMGVGGEEVAGRLAEAGRDVTGVEHRLVGGECPYWACVPTKMMVRAAGLLAEGRRIGAMAGSAAIEPDWAPVAARIRAEATDNWDDRVAVDRFTGKGGRFLRGRAVLAGRDPGTGQFIVRVTGPGGSVSTVTAAEGVMLATGSDPAVPPVPGLAGTPYWTNREAVTAEEVPGSLIVLGGGPVGAEFAQVFARFGTRVTLVEAAPGLLPSGEPESGELLRDVFDREGIEVRAGTSATRVSHGDGGFTVELSTESSGQFSGQFSGGGQVTADRLLVATGRRASLRGRGLASIGLADDAPSLAVDDRMRVQGADRVWAIGDITGHGAFTHVAMYQAGIAVRDILGTLEPGQRADYRALPGVTFTDPEIGQAGLTEQRARDRGIAVQTGITQIPSSTRGWIHGPGNDGFIKLVADRDTGLLVGATSAGPAGGEVLGTLAAAIHGRVPVATLGTMIYAYPTFHRAIEDALRNLR